MNSNFSETAANKPTVLYIGSSYNSRLFIARMISFLGFEQITVYHDENISERLKTVPNLDLIVLDSLYIGAEGQDANECFEQYLQLKTNPMTQSAPLVVITAENEFEQEFLDKFEADKHIVRPVDLDEFRLLLHSYLDE